MVRNADKLYYPIKAAIESILPVCDEFVIALGKGDEDDRTEEIIRRIESDKINIINTVWDVEKNDKYGNAHAHQTNIALDNCRGDWCFYIQADEVLHEKYLGIVQDRCLELLDDKEVEAIVFNYKHFWGDYDHYQIRHGWYKKEVRIVRNRMGIRSHGGAQGFRTENGGKPRAASVNAEIFHYGWVRPPRYMSTKDKSFKRFYKENEIADLIPDEFDFGPMGHLPVYKGSHPKVMKEWLERFNWDNKLNYSPQQAPFYKDDIGINRPLRKSEIAKNKILSRIEQTIFNRTGLDIYLSSHRNFVLLRGK